jgi:hypothetical protein
MVDAESIRDEPVVLGGCMLLEAVEVLADIMPADLAAGRREVLAERGLRSMVVGV